MRLHHVLAEPLAPRDVALVSSLPLRDGPASSAPRSGGQVADRSDQGDLRGYFERLRQATEEAPRAAQLAREAAEAAARAEALAAERGSLQRLLEGYLGGPEAASKPSSRDARNVLTNHILKAFPELMARKAADIGPADLRPVFARLIDAGKAAQLAATTRPRNVARDSATGSRTVVH